MKSGTSTLSYLLEQHPQIFISDPREINYFCGYDDEWSRGIEWYEKYFEGSQGKKSIGEASTAYSKYPSLPNCASRIYEVLPEAQIIYIMRNPIERTWSHYWHSVTRDGERRTPNEVITENSHHIAISRYYMQISEYLRYFDRNSVLLLLLDDLNNNPQSFLREVFRFLKVDEDFIPSNPSVVKNPFRETQVDGSLLESIRNVQIVRNALSIIPNNVKEVFGRPFKKKVKNPTEIPHEIRDIIQNELREDIMKIEELMDMDLSFWFD